MNYQKGKFHTYFEGHIPSLLIVLIISATVNILALTGSFFMLLVYDKAIPSGSLNTLLALSIIALALYIFYGILDYLRSRILARTGTQAQLRFDRSIMKQQISENRKKTGINTSDLDKISQFMASPICLSILDIAWSPIFIACSFLFHPWLGIFTIASIGLMMGIATITQLVTRASINRSQKEFWYGHNLGREIITYKEQVVAFGMMDRLLDRWANTRLLSQEERVYSGDQIGAFTSASKVSRLIAQSGILALGGYLVIRGEIPAGMMIAGSILLGRALTPIDQTMSQWRLVSETIKSWHSLGRYLETAKEEEIPTVLPVPHGTIEFHSVYSTYQGNQEPTLKNVSFKLPAGKVLGIAGPNGSGKSTLAKLLIGQFPPLSGTVTIDDASIKNFTRETIGFSVGYLPQKNFMFHGTVTENISRFDDSEDSEKKAINSARHADCHNMIMKLDNGYETILPGQLSSGQLQRISLARALYREPQILLFDEPSNHLDEDGREALRSVIKSARQMGKTVIIIAHNRAMLSECDMLLLLVEGVVQNFGSTSALMSPSKSSSATPKCASAEAT